MASMYQKGSAHIAIIIVLVVALIGALGWIFWQNFTHNKPKGDTVASDTRNTDEQSKSESRTVEGCLEKEGLCLEYPENWKLDVTSHDGTNLELPYDQGSLKNEDGKAVLFLSSGINGIGGACDPETMNNYDFEVTEVQKTKQDNLYAAKAIYMHPKDENGPRVYTPYIYLTKTAKKESSHTCLPDIAMLYEGNISRNGVRASTSIGVYPMIRSDAMQENMPQSYGTRDEAEQRLRSDELVKGYQALLTAYYK